MLGRTIVATLLLSGLLATTATAGWRAPSAAPLDAATGANARTPATALLDGTPYVAWEEAGAIRVSRLTDAGWEPVGGALGTGGNSLAPALTVAGDTLFAAWEDRGRGIAGARLTATGWEPLPLLGDQYSYSPSLAVASGAVHAAYSQGESSGFDVHVARLGATAWEGVGGVLDASSRETPLVPLLAPAQEDGTDPVLASDGTRLFAAWQEGSTVRAAQLDGTNWPLLGDAVTTTGSPTQVDLALAGGVPYVAWRAAEGAFRTRVARFQNGTWAEPTASLAGDQPDLATIGGRLWLTWSESKQVRVARLAGAGTAWEQPATGINRSSADRPALLDVAGIPFVAFAEGPTTATLDLRVARLEPEFLGTTATATSDGATLVTRLATYGLPYPVSFSVGATETAPQTASGDPATVAATISGLAPRTSYTATPSAAAGAGPAVPGPSVTFTTSKKNGRG